MVDTKKKTDLKASSFLLHCTRLSDLKLQPCDLQSSSGAPCLLLARSACEAVRPCKCQDRWGLGFALRRSFTRWTKHALIDVYQRIYLGYDVLFVVHVSFDLNKYDIWVYIYYISSISVFCTRIEATFFINLDFPKGVVAVLGNKVIVVQGKASRHQCLHQIAFGAEEEGATHDSISHSAEIPSLHTPGVDLRSACECLFGILIHSNCLGSLQFIDWRQPKLRNLFNFRHLTPACPCLN